jgi:hypothetical protein
VPIPGHSVAGSHWRRPQTLEDALKRALNAFAITFEGRVLPGEDQ